MGCMIENILPQIDYFYLETNYIKSFKTRLYLLNFSKLNIREPIEVNYSVAIRTNSYDKGHALSIVSYTGDKSFNIY